MVLSKKEKRERKRAMALACWIRMSGITASDAESVRTHYAVCGPPGSHRISEAMHILALWLREDNEEK
jgi:hypothetical protein